MLTSNLFLIGLAGAGMALVFAALMIRKVLKTPEGCEKTVGIAKAIRTGSNAYLKRQLRTVAIIIGPVFLVLFLLAWIPFFISGIPLADWFAGMRGEDAFYLLDLMAPFAFLTGAIFTALSGWIGMKVATNANGRTATACKESLNKGLRVSFSAGTVMGFTVVGLSLLDMVIWFAILRFAIGINDPQVIGNSMIKFGLGVAFMAMFARVGGGIFTKAADVGADLVGKVEAGIPEDDPRNPAVIADNVGDNVGDVAGMGADLYEAFAHAVIATFALGAGLFGFAGLLFPLLICVLGVAASIVGTFFVRTKENASQKSLLKSLHKGTWVAAAITILGSLPIAIAMTFLPVGNNDYAGATRYGRGSNYYGSIGFHNIGIGGEYGQWIWGVYACIVIGVLAGILIGFFTEYYTSDTQKPTKELAEATKTGSATVMIGGVALGMKATVFPVLTIIVAVLGAFFAGGGLSNFMMGMFGIGIGAVGMLSTLGINLATDAFGPVADNAGGIAQMAGMDPCVRERTDALDSLGNTTAATGKGFSIGSTAFTAVALLVSYYQLMPEGINVSITNPMVLVGIFIGGVTAFFFAALCIRAVHKAAQSVVIEVRRQFREIPGLMEGTGAPDYQRCVDMCTRAALRKMIAPAMLTIGVPIVTGLLLGPAGVLGFMGGTVVTGFMLALFMMISGGAWDNAKKYIEAGRLKAIDEKGKPILDADGNEIVFGKGSDEHKAAVMGDTVGDPFKDTAGPSFNILITLSASIALVFVNVAVNTGWLGNLF